jgi:DNA topoisomerase-2
MKLLPWFKGHLGKVEYNKELNRNESFGIIERNNMTSYTITELPIGIDYSKYCVFLDKLCENGTIQDFDDLCDPKTDKILFNIKTSRDFTRKHEDDRKLYETFHLIKSLPETLCFIDDSNKVVEFSSVQEILDEFIKIRLKYYQKRKDYIIESIKNNLIMLASKYHFVKGIVDETIIVNKRKKDNIEAQLDKIDKIHRIDGNYNYLLSMPIHSLTHEKLEELKKMIDEKKAEYKETKETSIQTMWLNDLHELKKCL